MIIRGFVKVFFMDIDIDTTGLKIKDDKILFEKLSGSIKK